MENRQTIEILTTAIKDIIRISPKESQPILSFISIASIILLIAILVFVPISILLLNSEAANIIWTAGAIITIIIFSGAFILLYFSFRNAETTISEWEALILDIDTSKSQELRTLLTELRTQAYNTLSPKVKKINSEQIRANIFFPNIKKATPNKEFCRLKIQHDIQSNMKDENEKSISFQLGEGVTGQVFADRQPRFSQRKGENWQLFDLPNETPLDPYLIPEKSKSVINPKLRWILSIPIEKTNSNSLLAVLNIDCLGPIIKHEHSGMLHTAISDSVPFKEICTIVNNFHVNATVSIKVINSK